MPMTRFTRLANVILVLMVCAPWAAHADAPDSCKFLTPAAMSTALGKPVTGDTMSVVDHSGASASSCTCRAGNDTDALMADLTDDIVYQSPHEPQIVGKDAVRKWVAAYSAFERYF